jgi:hypothetical protein
VRRQRGKQTLRLGVVLAWGLDRLHCGSVSVPADADQGPVACLRTRSARLLAGGLAAPFRSTRAGSGRAGSLHRTPAP